MSLTCLSIHLFCLFSSSLSSLSPSVCGLIDSSLGYPKTDRSIADIGISPLLLSSFSLSSSPSPQVLTIVFMVWYCPSPLLINSLLDSWVNNQGGRSVGWNGNPKPKEGDEVWREADLRSGEKKKRTLHFFVNGKLEKIFFYNVPERVKMGVVMSEQNDCIEFLSLEELSSPSIPPNDYAFGYAFEGDF